MIHSINDDVDFNDDDDNYLEVEEGLDKVAAFPEDKTNGQNVIIMINHHHLHYLCHFTTIDNDNMTPSSPPQQCQ